MKNFAAYTTVGFLTLGSTFQSEAADPKRVDNLETAQKVESYLGQYCISYKASDAKNCVDAYMEATETLSLNFEKYLDKYEVPHTPLDNIRKECTESFNRVRNELGALVAEDQQKYSLRYITDGLIATGECLIAIESAGIEYGINYMPSTRAILYAGVREGMKGNLIIRHEL